MKVNQLGQPIETETLYGHGFPGSSISEYERDRAIDLLCQHLKVQIVRTNATKHGGMDLVLEAL